MLRTTVTILLVLLATLVVLVGSTTTARATRVAASQRSAAMRSSLRAATLVALGIRDGNQAAATGQLRAAVRRHRDVVVDLLTSVATTLGQESRSDVVGLCRTLKLTGPLIHALHHPSPARRTAAAETLGLFAGPDEVAALHLAMRDPHPQVRVAAARAYLAAFPDQGAPAIVRMLTSEDERVAGELAEVLRQEGPRVSQALFREWQTGTRTPTLLMLISQSVEQSTAVGILADAVSSPDPVLRRAAVAGLSNIPTTLALTALTDATTDPDVDVRAQAVSALGTLAGPASLPVLIAMLDDRAWAVRHRAAAALAATPEGPRLLAGLLGQATPFVTTAITTALQRAMTTGTLLTDLVHTDPAVIDRAQRAVFALAGRPEMAKVLQAAVSRHPDPDVRRVLADLLAARDPNSPTARAQLSRAWPVSARQLAGADR